MCGLVVGGQLGHDTRRELLAEFDTPLVEGVDAPDHALLAAQPAGTLDEVEVAGHHVHS